MKAANIIKTAVWMTFFAGISTAGIKYVAVVETDVGAASGAAAKLNAAEVREITAELRRQATENLPSGRYSVMTSETVQSMGGAVLEECAEENCVIALGSKIGADYIVRGTVSKFQTMFTLAIELYETENGTLVVSSKAVRSGNLEELLGMTATASANMFKKFAGVKVEARKSKTEAKTETEAIAQKPESEMIKYGIVGMYSALQYQVPLGTPVSWGGVHLETGFIRKNGVFFGWEFGGGWDYFTDSASCYFLGIGIFLGNVYNLVGQLQLVYGGSVGVWFVDTDGHYNYKDYEDVRYMALNYLAPFVKLRWNFVELTYKGLLGVRNVDKDGISIDNTVFGWNNHQLMIGIYIKKKPPKW